MLAFSRTPTNRNLSILIRNIQPPASHHLSSEEKITNVSSTQMYVEENRDRTHNIVIILNEFSFGRNDTCLFELKSSKCDYADDAMCTDLENINKSVPSPAST
jgi:hypothetical protein